MDCSPLGSSAHGILQSRVLEWVAMPSSRGPSRPRGLTCVSYVVCTGRQVLYHLTQQRSPRILELVAYPFSRGSSQPRNQTEASCIAGRFFTSWSYQGSPTQRLNFVQVNKEIQSETRNSVYQNELDECETIWMKLFSHLADDKTEVQIPITFKGIIIIMDMG